MIKRILILVSVLIALGAGGAYAWWTTTGSGTASASVGTLTAPGAPTRTGAGGSVNLSWTAAVLSGGGMISYHLERSTDPVTTWSDACGTTAGSGTTATTCTDTPVAGTYRYRATAIYNSWTAEGPVSDPFLAAGSDTTEPTVTIEQASGQNDPTNASPIHFTAIFSEPVTGFATGDLTLTGTAAATSAVVSEVAPNDGTSYDVAVSGMTGDGTVIASIGAGVAEDGASNANEASLSIDNTVSYDGTDPTSSASGADGDWHQSAVTVGLSATDPGANASGVAEITYTVDGGAAQTISDASGDVIVPAPADHSNDGQHTIVFFASDNAGNQETPSNSVTVRIDTTKPTSSASGADASWHSTAVTVGLSATDPGAPPTGSGVAEVTYTVDGGAAQTISGASGDVIVPAPADHSNDGLHTIVFFASDNAGNQETPSNSATVKIDTTKPSSTIATFPASPDGSNDWFTQASVTFTLSATDPGAPTTGSGIANITYTIDGGPQLTYSGTVTISTQGDHTVTFIATDDAGNVESTNTTHIELDNVNPTTTITLDPASANGTNSWYKTSLPTFTLGGTDASSGVAATFYKIDAGATQTYSGAVTIPEGQHTISYWSTDNAGNTETTVVSGTIKVDTTNPTNALSLSVATGAFLSGSTLYFRNAAAGSFTLSNALTDPSSSGPASTTFPLANPSGWTHAADTVTTPAGGPYASNYSWALNASGTPSGAQALITGTDAAGNTNAGTQLTFTNDITAPTGGAVSVNSTAGSPAGITSSTYSTTFAIDSRTEFTDATSGLASSILTVQSTTLTGTSTCGVAGGPFTSPTTISATTQPSGIVQGFCYLYKLTGTDNVGNTTSTSTTVIVNFDTFTVSVTSPQTAGVAFNASITAMAGASTDTTYTGTKTIIFTGPASSPGGNAPSYPASVTFTNGVGTASITLFNAATTALTATQGGITGTSANVTVASAGASKFALRNCKIGATTVPCATSFAQGNGSTLTANIAVTDAFGNVPASTTVTINLGLTGNGSIFSFASASALTNTTTTITNGVQSGIISVFKRANANDTQTVTLSAATYTSLQFTVTK